jgi:hypothetical protein
MATAVIYPEPQKLKRKGGSFSGKDQPVNAILLSRARAVLGTEFVTPILEGNQSSTKLTVPPGCRAPHQGIVVADRRRGCDRSRGRSTGRMLTFLFRQHWEEVADAEWSGE